MRSEEPLAGQFLKDLNSKDALVGWGDGNYTHTLTHTHIPPPPVYLCVYGEFQADFSVLRLGGIK